MAVINKTMKTFNVPNGNNTNCYEIVDDKGRKCIATDWASNSTSAFAVGDYVVKDGVVYRFKSAHTANSAWSSSEVDATNLGAELSRLSSAFQGNLQNVDIVSGFIGGAFSGSTLTIATSQFATIVYFPVISGKKYTIVKPETTSYWRVGYSATSPAVGTTLTNYDATGSTSSKYATYTAPITGYLAAYIAANNNATSKASFESGVYAYEGDYNSDFNIRTSDLININKFNGIGFDAVERSIESVQLVNIIEGYLYAQVGSSSVVQSTNKTSLSVYFPVKANVPYTIDKKKYTNHTRSAYTTNAPKYGDSVQNYESLGPSEHSTFVASQNGYVVIWVLDTTSDTSITIDQILNNIVAYEGEYREGYTQETIVTSAENVNKVFYCGHNRELSTLKAGIEEATKYMNATLYVDAGTYDLIDEFGSAWFEALDGTKTLVGLKLKNRIHVVFSPNSKVVSNYTGDNQYAQSLYSPFNAGEYGFTLENLTLECSRCRYGVHDERNGGTEQYKAEYINCSMYIDNSDNDYWESKHCIGGGLGSNAEIIIKNSVFKTDDASARGGVYYHQSNDSSNTNYKSTIVIDGCYFITGTVIISDTRTTSTGNGKTSYMITGNSIPVKYSNTDDEGLYVVDLTNPNSVLYEWGNKIRTP